MIANAEPLDQNHVIALNREMMVEDGIPKIMPSRFYAQMDPRARIAISRGQGLYSLPTVELVDFLRTYIAGRSALEIGAGNGALASALGIRATDSCQQEEDWIRLYAALALTAPVKYGRNVEKIDAHGAVFCYRPRVVVACWVTHRRMDPEDTTPGAGNHQGVIEEEIVANCDEYIFVGNLKVHENKPIMKLPHKKFSPPWLWSRTVSDAPNFIGFWKRNG
jgi:hypothetical protein